MQTGRPIERARRCLSCQIKHWVSFQEEDLLSIPDYIRPDRYNSLLNTLLSVNEKTRPNMEAVLLAFSLFIMAATASNPCRVSLPHDYNMSALDTDPNPMAIHVQFKGVQVREQLRRNPAVGMASLGTESCLVTNMVTMV